MYSHMKLLSIPLKHQQVKYLSQIVDPKIPVITVPTYMQRLYKKLRKKTEMKEALRTERVDRSGNKNIPIITCKNSKLNHYYGQRYEKGRDIPLASVGWQNKKHYGDYFTIHRYSNHPSLPGCETEFPSPLNEKVDDFSSFAFHTDIMEALKSFRFKGPSGIQNLAIPPIMEKRNVACLAETGSGKTLAYLAPVMHFITIYKNLNIRENPKAPFGLIFLPSKELAKQVGSLAQELGAKAKINVKIHLHKTRNNAFTQDVLNYESIDLVVTTPGAFESLIKFGGYDLRQVQHLVIDEIDTFLDDSFLDFLRKIFDKLQLQKQVDVQDGAQVILTGATMPHNIQDFLQAYMDPSSIQTVSSNFLHRIMPHVEQRFFRVRKSEKAERLLEIARSDFKHGRPLMIFFNTSDGCNWGNSFLKENNIPTVKLHGNMQQVMRDKNFKQFFDAHVNILCCTDLASRGLDTVHVQHVLNYEFPSFMSDYIHRSGRTGRLGSDKNCCVTNLIGTRHDAELVKTIETAVRLSKKLPSIDANIRKQFDEYHFRKDMETFLRKRDEISPPM